MKLVLLSIWLLISGFVLAQPAGYSFGKHILIDAAQIPGATPLTNFPLLISFTSSDLRHVSNGGSVQNLSGFDIVFFAGDCSTQLSHQIESYNPTTGQFIAWVRIPSLSATVNTGIQMYYGNNSIVANPSTTATWSAGFDGVWHLHSDLLDSSTGGNNGTNNGSVNTAGAKIADGQNFTDPNHWIELSAFPNRGGSFSISAWFRSADVTRSGQRIFCDDATNANGCYAVSLGDPGTGMLRFYIRGLTPVTHDTGNIIANNTWYHVAVVYDASTQTKYLYVNGALTISGVVTGTLGTPTGNASIGGEVAAGETANRFHGDLDEVRSIPVVLSGNWIAAEYNNQNSPSTFYSVSAQMTATDLCALLPIELLNFEVTATAEFSAEIFWTTASEINNSHFVLERSSNGQHWSELTIVNGMGNSSSTIQYNYTDTNPLRGITYYRLKQVDFDGSFTYSAIRSINSFDATKNVMIHPNPASDQLTISGISMNQGDFEIYSSSGRLVTNQTSIISNEIFELQLNISNLPNGIYFLSTAQGKWRFVVAK
jgi:biopolymer transport protein ExbB